METIKNFKSIMVIAALALSLAFFAVACKKAEVVPTPVAPMTPATEVPAPTPSAK